MAGRASGQALDLRCDFAVAPYDTLAVRKPRRTDGDVAARVASASTRSLESLRLDPRHSRRACPTARSRVPFAQARGAPARPRLCRRLARPGAGRADQRPRRHASAVPSARSVVVELAGARARGDRQHRSRLPADQQVVQPVLQRPRPLDAMLHILKQIAKTGIKTERAPAPAEDMVVVARSAAGRCCARSAAR